MVSGVVVRPGTRKRARSTNRWRSNLRSISHWGQVRQSSSKPATGIIDKRVYLDLSNDAELMAAVRMATHVAISSELIQFLQYLQLRQNCL
jgi:hypothetical protein